MTTPASRHASAAAELDRLADSGALDELAWALTGVLLSAAERLAPEAKTPAEAAWIVASRANEEAASTTDTAGHCRPLTGGVHPVQHDGRVSACQQDDAAAMEDDRDAITTDN